MKRLRQRGRTLLLALALAACAASASAQVVEQPRTWTGLLAAYPCVPWLSGRITRVTDAQSSSSVGGGGGSAQVWVQCDGIDTWSLVTIGSSGGGAATSVAGSATLPATCTEKDLYQDTDSGGTEFYVCTATNTWTKAGDVLTSGDADGQTIQGRTGANAARVDIGETDANQATLIGGGETHGFIYAYDGGIYGESPDGGTVLDLYNEGVEISSDGSVSFSGDTSTGLGSYAGLTAILGSRVNITSEQAPPTNANDACAEGDTIDTATFHYYCYATDSWVRVAMSTWP